MAGQLDNLLHQHINSKTNSSNPRKVNDKAHNQSPYGEDEPSPRTTYK